MFFKNYKVWETELAGRKLTLETGKMCGLAGASIMARYGDTNVLCNVTMSAKPREGVDFFPLSVDYEEKMYSVGRIPGSFQRREARPSEKAILTSRCIDRPIRPLFPKDMRNDVSVVATVMSVDPDCSPEITAMIGVSAAIAISDIPWDGPISGVNVGLVDGQIVINPTLEQRAHNDLNLTVASTGDLVAMIEAGGNEIDDDTMFNAIMAGHEENKKIVAFINGIVEEVGKPKKSFQSSDPDPAILQEIEDFCIEDVKKALDTDDKNVRDERLRPIYDAVHEKFDDRFEGEEGKIEEILYLVQKHVVRAWLKDEHKRVDGRGIDEIRPLNAEIDLLARAHGSGMFTRGQTQVLSVTTLGPMNDAQQLDGLDEQTEKRYMHHYNFPSYSVGETKPSRGPGRREIGHGALAERSIAPVVPGEQEFPYAIRVSSEIMESNGSTSMASVCAGTMSLLAAGVPLKRPVAGISVGLVTEQNDQHEITSYKTLLDIIGSEDFYGDMDFKLCGTSEGVTGYQLDLKLPGIPLSILEEAIHVAKAGRTDVLKVMNEAIAAPAQMSPNAPRIETTKIPADRIGELIGPGGKNIKAIQAESGADINIEEDGTVHIYAAKQEGLDRALELVTRMFKTIEIGELYTGKIVSTTTFGAFMEVLPGKDGLIHISELAEGRTAKTEDVVSVGDVVTAKCIGIDDKGRVKMSIRAALRDAKAAEAEAAGITE